MYQVLSIKRKLPILVLAIFLHTTYYILHTTPTLANGLSLGIYPPIIQIKAVPPAKIQASITIHNFGDQTVNLGITFRPFTAPQKENGEVSYLSQNNSFGENPLFFQHVAVLQDEDPIQSLILYPKQEKKLTLQIDLPSDEATSDYYFSIIFVSKTAPNTTSAISQNAIGIGTNVLFSIGPKEEPQAILQEYSTPFISQKGPTLFAVRVKNTGRHFTTAQGNILIKNVFGQTVGKVDLPPQNILAGSTRSLTSHLSPLTSKAGWPESFLLGPYTATLTLALSENGPTITKTIHFVGLPIQILIGLVITILIVILIKNRIKSYGNQK